MGHFFQRGIWSIRFLSKSIIISGSYDKTIRVSNVNELPAASFLPSLIPFFLSTQQSQGKIFVEGK